MRSIGMQVLGNLLQDLSHCGHVERHKAHEVGDVQSLLFQQQDVVISQLELQHHLPIVDIPQAEAQTTEKTPH